MMPGDLGRGGFLPIQPLWVRVSPESGSQPDGSVFISEISSFHLTGSPTAGTLGLWAFMAGVLGC